VFRNVVRPVLCPIKWWICFCSEQFCMIVVIGLWTQEKWKDALLVWVKTVCSCAIVIIYHCRILWCVSVTPLRQLIIQKKYLPLSIMSKLQTKWQGTGAHFVCVTTDFSSPKCLGELWGLLSLFPSVMKLTIHLDAVLRLMCGVVLPHVFIVWRLLVIFNTE
jgi:hypothetical protein